MRPSRCRAALASGAAALLSALALAPQAAAQAAAYQPCAPSGFECAVVPVPLDRSGQVAGQIGLSATRVRTGPANTSAVLALAGGPGQAAVPLAGSFAQLLAPGLQGRDFLTFDQRGTGQSGRLSCPAVNQGGSALSVASRCSQQLGPLRAFFRTVDSVLDIEALRVASGYTKLVLYGVSYGTKVAEDYAAAFPQNVEALVLDSVVLPEGPDPLRAAPLANVDRVLTELCQGGECRGVTPSARVDARKLASRLRKKALRGRVTASSGRRVRVSMGESGLFDVLVAGDLNPTLRAELPGSMRAALSGDATPLLRLAVRSAGLENRALQVASRSDSDALYLATVCEEAPFRWTRTAGADQRAREITAAARSLPASKLGPFGRSVPLRSGLAPLCLGWRNATGAPPAPGPLPQVPTLVLEGRGDLRTPLSDAQALAARIPGAQLVPIPFTGHSVLGTDVAQCADRAVAAFFAGQPVQQCAPGDNPFSPTPRPPRRLGSVPAPRALRGTPGRTLNALAATITDARRQVIGATLARGAAPSAVGGLRGGRAVVSGDVIALRAYEYVPGVRVTGSFTGQRQGTFRVSGTGARGTVVLRDDGSATGTLGGRRVRFPAQASAASSAEARLPTLAEVLRLPGLGIR